MLLSVPVVHAQPGIDFFEGSLAEAQAASAKEDKLIFMDAYATWCGPCKWMSANVFTDEKVGSLFNKSFVNLKVDVDKGEGGAIASKYGISALPTLLILDSKGKVVAQSVGARDAEQLRKWAEDALKDQSKPGNSSPQKAVQSKPAQASPKPQPEPKPKPEPKPEPVAEIPASRTAPTPVSKPTARNLPEAVPQEEQDYGLDVEDWAQRLLSAIEVQDAAAFEDLVAEAEGSGDADRHLYILEAHRAWVLMADPSSSFVKRVMPLMQDDELRSPDLLTTAAWYTYECSFDAQELNFAADWAWQSIEWEPGYYNHCIYAQLMYALGEMDAAREYGKKALDMARKATIDATLAEELLHAIASEN